MSFFEEAKDLTLDVKIGINPQITMVKEKILSAAFKGQSECYINFHLTEKTLYWLQEEGFRTRNQYDDNDYIISWD